ncbi:hypothetical protein GCM10023336_75480 [Streptomyces similanensis]|uniref:Uncharacterized protein n=1 Tax=Streptomyces similanensis TaxID=1274988 RepID=A0ABP9LRZ7_9ACTN
MRAPHPPHAAPADGVGEPVAAREELALHLIHVSPQCSCQGQTKDRLPGREPAGWHGNSTVTVVASDKSHKSHKRRDAARFQPVYR